MAEQCPRAAIDESDIGETPPPKITPTFLSPEDQTETGYSSAPYSPDLLSGTDSPSSVSDDRAQEDKSKSPKHTASNLTTTESRKSKFIRKSSPVKPKKAVKASEKKAKEVCSARNTEPSEEACATIKVTTSVDSSLWKSEEIPMSPEPEEVSLPPKMESPVKRAIEEPEIKTPSPKEKPSKSPRKGLLSKIQSLRSPKKAEKPLQVVSLPKEEKTTATAEKVKTTESTSTRRKIMQKFTKKSPAKAIQPARLSSTDVELEAKSGGSPKKTKKPYKFSPKKYKPLKQDEPVPQSSKQSPIKEPVSYDAQIAPASPLTMLRRGIEKMDIPGRLSGRRRSPRRWEETQDLITEPENIESGAIKEDVTHVKEGILVDLPPPSPVEWRPRNRDQEGGFGDDDGLEVAEISSESEGPDSEEPDTPTELTLLSDSSGVQGGSESKKGFRSDSLSKWSSLEEEVFDEGALGVQRPSRPKLQRQSNVQDLPEEDSQAATSSPGKKAPFKRQDAEDASNE